MKPPVVGKRYKVYTARKGNFVGRCVLAKGEFWEFRLESFVQGATRDWGLGDTIAVRAALIRGLEEIPLDVEGK